MWKSNRRQHKRKLAIHLKVSYCPVLAKPNLHATQNYLKLAQGGSDWLRLDGIGWDWHSCTSKRCACTTSLDSHQLSWGGWDVNSVFWAPALSSGGGQVRLDTLYALLQCSVILSTNTSRESIVYTGSVSATPESGVQIHIHGRPTLADCRAMSFVQIQNWINLPFYTLTPARESAECR